MAVLGRKPSYGRSLDPWLDPRFACIVCMWRFPRLAMAHVCSQRQRLQSTAWLFSALESRDGRTLGCMQLSASF